MKILAGIEPPDDRDARARRRAGRAARPPRRGTARHRHHPPGAQPVPEPEHRGQHLHGPRADARRRDGRPRARSARSRTSCSRGSTSRWTPTRTVGDLRVGQQQIVEIARALAEDARVLIMDEPTSALSVAEVHVLFRVIRDLTAHGVAIVYISHHLEEALEIADHVVVLPRRPARRRGRGGERRRALDRREDGRPAPGRAVPGRARRGPGRAAAGRGPRGGRSIQPGAPGGRHGVVHACAPARSWASTGSWAQGARSCSRRSPAGSGRSAAT